MEYRKMNIKEGVNLHTIKTEKFKTNLLAVYLSSPLTKKEVTQKALSMAIIRRGTENLKTQEDINCKLEELYGAELNSGMDKVGNDEVLKFYIESLNDNFTLKNEDVLKQSIELLFDVIFNPLTENGRFKDEYFENEKSNLKQIIEAKKDNKAQYATARTLEEMYGKDGYGLYTYGYIEDLEKLSNQEVYNSYKKMLANCKIDIFVSGDINESECVKLVDTEIEKFKIDSRNVSDLYLKNEVKNVTETKEVIEKMDVTQGKLVIGLDITNTIKDERPQTAVYNAILGGGANSKLFQNVREKASLAYSAGSLYIKNKNNIIIKSGIEPKNYEKALNIIKEQLEDMKNDKFDEKDMQNAKKIIIASYEAINDEQDSSIAYSFNQEIENNKPDIEGYVEKIKEVTKEQIVEIAKKININTIYFLTSNKE